MPASSQYHRPLGRSSAHRQALLKNLVTSLVKHEQISTTYAKAKEAQRVAEKLITLAKKNTAASRTKALGILFEPHKHMEKVFGELAKRYENRPGGYTRVLPCEPLKNDQAASAILSLVDGPRDMRFKMTAKALLRQQSENLPMNEITATNIRKVTRFREGGTKALMEEVLSQQKETEAREEDERDQYEEYGNRFKWTTDLPKDDLRWKHKRGPGRLVRRQIRPEDEEFPAKDGDWHKKSHGSMY